MRTNFFDLGDWRCNTVTPSFRPALERLEAREVLAAPAVPAALANSVVPIAFTGVANQAGQLVALGRLGNTAFTAPLTLSASPNADPASCPILHLQLNPIHLNLLGITVDTSAICLNIDATPGQGQLLGNLLCNLSTGLLNGGTLGNLLGSLTPGQLNGLLNGLTGLLNGGFAGLTNARNAQPSVDPTGNILHLSLGPVNLNLLGLNVNLDNCAGGPVTVDVGTQPGGLLGNLLNSITQLLNTNPNSPALGRLLRQVGQDLFVLGSILP